MAVDPFVRFLFNHPASCGKLTDPYGTEISSPSTVATLANMYLGTSYREPLGRINPGEYWSRFMEGSPDIEAWFQDSGALRSPLEWEHGLAATWSVGGIWEPPTPYQFSQDFLPLHKHMRIQPVYLVRGIDQLSAYTHGFPLNSGELAIARRALSELLRVPQFVLWAGNINIEHLPLGHHATRTASNGIISLMAERQLLIRDPLRCGRYTLIGGLPETFHNPRIMLGLPRYPFWVPRSSKTGVTQPPEN